MLTLKVHTDRLSSVDDIERWFEFVGIIAKFAYALGWEYAGLGGKKEDVPCFFEPMALLAWEAGWEDFQAREVN